MTRKSGNGKIGTQNSVSTKKTFLRIFKLTILLNNNMRHLDLFSGIGGFSLAASWVWGEEYENVGFCDNNEFCQAVIKKNFKNAKIYDDIRNLKGTKIKNLDLLTGGFPCQPFS